MADTQTEPVAAIIDRYNGDPGMLIPMMQDLQAEHGYLPQGELKELSSGLAVPLAQVYSVATFYSSFRLMPKGDHTIQLCMGTVCFLKGAGKIAEAIREQFDLVPGGTSPDRKFTFAPVNCVGACALAPVMVVDGEYYGGLTTDSAVGLLEKIAAGDKPAGEAVVDKSKAAAEKEKKRGVAKKKKAAAGEKKGGGLKKKKKPAAGKKKSGGAKKKKDAGKKKSGGSKKK